MTFTRRKCIHVLKISVVYHFFFFFRSINIRVIDPRSDCTFLSFWSWSTCSVGQLKRSRNSRNQTTRQINFSPWNLQDCLIPMKSMNTRKFIPRYIKMMLDSLVIRCHLSICNTIRVSGTIISRHRIGQLSLGPNILSKFVIHEYCLPWQFSHVFPHFCLTMKMENVCPFTLP